MRPHRCLVLAAATLVVTALALVSGAQEPPPRAPSKALPTAQPPGGAPIGSLTSPRTRATYLVRVEPEPFDSDAGEVAEAEEEATAPAAVPLAIPKPGAALAKAKASIPASEFYKGTARRAAKLSIAAAPLETFDDLEDLVSGLPSKKAMTGLTPPISTKSTSNRVAQEKRNVRVTCWLYAASREDDNDYHLILGRDPDASGTELYMTMELSGLPSTSAASFPRLKAARDSFNAFFGSDRPGTRYDFYDPPIPVEVEGSLFFDASHATGTPPGPSRLRPRMPTIWEVHPITEIVFEP